MAVQERFGTGPSIIVGVQSRPIENDPDVQLLGVRVLKTNIQEERSIIVDLTVDGALFEINMMFRDETLSTRDFAGKPKKKNEETTQ